MSFTPSTFSEISKTVGFEKKIEIMPDIEVANELLILVKSGNEAALTKVLRVYRFASSPTNSNEYAANALISEAVSEGRRIFV